MKNKNNIAWVKNLRNELSLESKIVLCGVGNELRSDDGIGPAIIRLLAKWRGYSITNNPTIESGNILLINSGENPENFLSIIEKFRPSHIIFLDAANLKSSPGMADLISPKKVDGNTISTHRIPLSFFVDYLQKTTGAKVFFLGIQPLNCQLGEKMSPTLIKAGEEIAFHLQKILSRE